MTRITTLCLGGLLLASVGSARNADAQIVRIGPWGGVSVRAPFVRVEVSPYGDTYVRAPFTEVQTPGRRGRVVYGDYGYSAAPYDSYGVPRPRGPVRVVQQDVDQMSLAELQRSLVANWNTLRADLGRFETGAGWQDYLQLPEELAVADPTSSSVSAGEVERLSEVLARYDEVAEADEYRMISRLESFQRTRHRLAAYIDRLSGASPPADTEVLPAPLPQ